MPIMEFNLVIDIVKLERNRILIIELPNNYQFVAQYNEEGNIMIIVVTNDKLEQMIEKVKNDDQTG